MSRESYILMLTAASIGFIHTLLGPDHYVPFIVLSKARQWTQRKTAFITVLCGIAHVGSSVVIGIIGIALGIALNRLVDIEATRGEIAAWLMIAFGFAYLVWGIKQSVKHKKHSHLHLHTDGTAHYHLHEHQDDHTHFHRKTDYKELTPWILFTIFVFGPCEPFIPLFLYPAARNNLTDIILVTLAFTIATVGTMVTVVSFAAYGIRFLPRISMDRYVHAIAGGTIFLCGIGIKFLGL
jgi:nickel/cobalt transporter (NicO) family protein